MSAFGGKWTLKKLSILEYYLDAYTTALKDRSFELWYIDAFAGSGSIELSTNDQSDDDLRQFIDGSTQRAIKISNKQFDQLVFVESDGQRCNRLVDLKKKHCNRNIEIVNGDANAYLAKLDDDWKGRRGVLFLDPFSIQVRWDTLEKIESFRALDTWILFPVSAISRMLPRTRRPEEINEKWVSRLNVVYGDERWRELYHKPSQQDLFDKDKIERNPGVEGLCSIYKNNLQNLFGNRYLNKSCHLKHSRNSILFEFIFCAGHPAGAKIAKQIAGHLINHM